MSGWKWTTEREKKQLEDSFWTRARQTVEGATYGPQEPVYGPQEPVSPIADIAAQARAMPHGGVSTAEDLNTPGISTPEDSGWSPPGWAKSLWDGVQNTYGAIGPEGIAERFGADPNREQRSLPGVLGEIGGYQKTMFSGQDVLRGFGVETSGLPDSPFFPVQQAIDVGASPYNAAFLGSTAVGAPLKALPGALARAGAKDLAIGTTGVVAAQQTDENLPEGTPDWARPVLSTAAAIGAGALAHKAISVAPGAARSLHDSAISLDARINEPVSGPGGYVEQGMAASRPYARSATETRVAAGASPPLPPVGHDLADELLARKDQQIMGHPVASRLPGWARSAMAQVNPSITLERPATVAGAASANGKTVLRTMYDSVTEAPMRALTKAWADAKATYLGPADNPFKGTLKDRADNPEFYSPDTPEFAAARQSFQQAQDQAVTMHARTQVGADVNLYDPQKPGSFYLPTQRSRDTIDEAVGSISRQLGSSSKERAYESAYERWKAAKARGEDFKPELDVNTLVSNHNQWAAAMGANSIFKRGVGGLTKAEVMAETHPKLVAARDATIREVDSLRGRLATAEAKSATGTKVFDELYAALEKVRNAAPDEDFSPLETALRSGGRRLDQLLSRKEISSGEAARLRAELSTAQDKLANLRKDWRLAEIKGYSRVQQTGLYSTPEMADSIDRLTRGVPKGLQGVADVMNEHRMGVLSMDASPTTIQGLLSVIFDPVQAGKTTVANIVRRAQGGTLSGLEDALRTEPEMVDRFQFATGQAWRHQGPEFSAVQAANKPSLLARLPYIGPAYGKFENAMFAGVQSYAYAGWKTERDWLLRHNPQMTEAAADAAAARHLGRIIPGMNAAERGVLPGTGRAAAESTVLTSPSFTATPALYMADLMTAATRGLSKMATTRSANPAVGWRAMTGTEQLAVRSLMRMMAPATATIATSAYAASLVRGDTPEQAFANVQESLFDPSSRKWMALQIPGTDRTIPLPGPIRSFAKMVLPQKQYNHIPFANAGQWLHGRFSPSASTGVKGFQAATGQGLEDYRGNKVLEGDAPEKLARGLAYLGEQLEPTSISAASAAMREGKSGGDVVEAAGTQFLGSNIGQASPTEQLNDIARGMGSDTFKDLPTKTQAMIKESHPDLWNEYLSRLDDNTKTYYAKRAEFVRDQGESDSMLTRGVITPKRWAGDYHDRVQQLVGVGKGLFDNGVSKPRNAHDRYLQQIEAASVGNAGVPDWDKVDSWLAEQPVEDQKYIAEHASVPWTPVVAEYMAAAKSRNAMYELPRYAGVSAKDGEAVYAAKATIDKMLPPKAPVSMQIAALEKIKDTLTPAQGQAALALIYGTLKTSPARSNYKKAHPEVDKWFTPGALVP